MEHQEAIDGERFWQNTFSRSTNGISLADRLKEDKKTRTRTRPTAIPFRPGRNSLDLNKVEEIRPATTSTNSRAKYLSTAPIPTPLARTKNAQAGPSRNRHEPGTVRGSRKALDSSEGAGADWEMMAGSRYETRHSISPEKLLQATTNHHVTRTAISQATPHRRTDNTHRSGPLVDISASAVRTRRSVASGSASRSTSPQKVKSKGSTQRPKEIAEPYETPEDIENPDGPFGDEGRDSDVEYVPPSDAKARIFSTKKSSDSASPTKLAAERVDLKGKGKAPPPPTQIDLHEWNSSTGDEIEMHATQAPPTARQGIPSSNLGSDATTCKTAVVWCIDSQNVTRKMRVWQVELHPDGITLGDPRDRQTDHVFIGLSNIVETRTCERTGCPLILLDVLTPRKGKKVDLDQLWALLAQGVVDDIQRPNRKDIATIAIKIHLQPSDRANAFVKRYVNLATPLAERRIRLRPEQCTVEWSCAPPKPPSPSDPRPQLSPSRSPPPQIAKPASSRPQQVHGKDNSVIQRMQARVDRDDKAKSKGKGKERETQSELAFVPSDKAVVPAGDKRNLPRRTTRHSGQQIIDDLCSDTEVVPEPPRAPVLAPPPDRGTVLFPYPLTGRASLNITKGELWRVQSGEFLNDTLIEWGLKHLIDVLTDEGRDPNVHLFNSFFYTKVSSKDHDKRLQRGTESQAARWPAYETVRKWTKSVDVFSKKFIIVPINEDFHWYLAVIFNPGGMLVDTTADPPPRDPAEKVEITNTVTSEDTPDVKDENSVDNQLETIAATPEETQESIVAIAEPDVVMESEKSDVDMPLVGDDSVDELDCIDQPIITHRAPVSKMEGLSIASGSGKAAKKPSPPAGQEITSFTLSAFKEQYQPVPSGPAQPKLTSKPEPEAVKPVPKKADRPPDHVILKSQKPWVITFDSLGSQHKAVGKYLNEWLQWEARSKKGEQYGNVEVEYTHAQVPLQANFSDCGLYLVHYARRLLSEPDNILKLVERRLPHKATDERKQFDIDLDSTWKVSRDHNLRDEWQATITSLKEMYDGQQAKDAKDAKGDETKSKDGPGDEAVEGDSVDDVMLVAQPGLEPDQPVQGDAEVGETPGWTGSENGALAKVAPATTEQDQQEAIAADNDVPDQDLNDEFVAEQSPRAPNSLGLDQYGSRENSDASATAERSVAPNDDEEDDLESHSSESQSSPKGPPSPEQIVTAIHASSAADHDRFLGTEDEKASIDLEADSSEISATTETESDRQSHEMSDDNELTGEYDHNDDIDPALGNYQGRERIDKRPPGNLEDEDMQEDSPGKRFLSSSPDIADATHRLIQNAGLNHPSNPNFESTTSARIDNVNDGREQHRLSPDPPITRPNGYQGNTKDDAIDVDDDDNEDNQEIGDSRDDNDKENNPPRPDREISEDQHIVAEPPARLTPVTSTSERQTPHTFDLVSLGATARMRKSLENRQASSSPLTSMASSRGAEGTDRPPPPPPVDASPSHKPAKIAPPAKKASVPPWKKEEMTSDRPSGLAKFANVDPPSSGETAPTMETRGTRSSASDIVLVDQNGNVDDLESRSTHDTSPRRSRRVSAAASVAIESARTSPAPLSNNGPMRPDMEDSEFDDPKPRPSSAPKGRRKAVYGKGRTAVDSHTQTLLPYGEHQVPTGTSLRNATGSGSSNLKRRDESAPESIKTKRQKYQEGGPGYTPPARPARGQARQRYGSAAKKQQYDVGGTGIIELHSSSSDED